jgi:glycosyltransferase involved in cell wall biosynthesis
VGADQLPYNTFRRWLTVSAAQLMRIAIDANVLEAPWGGIPKYVDRIVAELLRGGDRVDLLANTRRLDRSIAGAHEVGVRVKGRAVWREAFLPLWLASVRPDVFWAPESVLPRLSPVPTVVTIHDLATVRFAGTKPEAAERSFQTTIRRSALAATRAIAVSQTTADDMRELWDMALDRLRVVPNGVDDVFTPGDREAARASVRQRWGVDAPFVLHVGSIEPRKGLDVLIDAAVRADGEGHDWRVVLAGSTGPLGVATAEKARASGVCDLLGKVDEDELLDLYRAAGAFAAPAIYEGFGIAPLEAMACETPAVIAGGSGGLEEISGPAAMVVHERTATAWQAAVMSALQRPPELIERGRALAARFRWSAVAAQTRDVLAEAAAERGRGRDR